MGDRLWDVEGAMTIVKAARELDAQGYDGGAIAGACIGHGAEMYKQAGYTRAEVEQHAMLLIGVLFGDPVPAHARDKAAELTAELRRRMGS